MIIDVNVNGQTIKLANTGQLVSGSQEFVLFSFHTSEDWNSLTIFCQFQQNGNSYNVYLNSDNQVYLPTEITGGYCDIMLYGTNGTIIATTSVLRLKIANNIIDSNTSSTQITQDLYSQLVDRVEKLSDEFETVKEVSLSAANTAEKSVEAAQCAGENAAKVLEQSILNAEKSAEVSAQNAHAAAEMASASAASVQLNVKKATDVLNSIVTEHNPCIFTNKVTVPSLQIGNTEINETQLQQLLALLNN